MIDAWKTAINSFNILRNYNETMLGLTVLVAVISFGIAFMISKTNKGYSLSILILNLIFSGIFGQFYYVLILVLTIVYITFQEQIDKQIGKLIKG